MRILLAHKAAAELRALSGVVALLTERGHDVHLVLTFVEPRSHGFLERWAEQEQRLTFELFPLLPRTPTRALSEDLRRTADYLRYLDPVYRDSPRLRARCAKNAPATAHRLRGLARLPAARGLLIRALQALDRRLEPPAALYDLLRSRAPDVVLTTTLVSVGSPHADLIRAAKRLGIPTGYLVFSWDNLTNKGLIREVPDEVLVWNDVQAREAVELHGISESRVRATGASSYDHWFDWTPSRTREEFAGLLGLRPDRPIVLYACSSNFIAPDEVGFVRRWIGTLRNAGGETAEAGIVVRPYPRNLEPWQGVQLDAPAVVVWPPDGEEPVDQESRQNYFDSLYHADAVVGINTSTQIEAAIVGRPVHTILAEQFRDTQAGTLHFRYLQNEDFGHLHAARTLDEHVELLGASLRGETYPERNRRFVRRFVRPLGLGVQATPLVADAIEQLGSQQREPARVRALPGLDLGLRYLALLSWRRRRRTRRLAKEAAHAKLPRQVEVTGSLAPPP
jgi:hypothetical protein